MRPLFTALGCVLLSITLSGCFVFNSLDLSPKLKPPELSTLQGKGADKVLVIDINGMISESAPSNFLGQSKGQGMLATVYDQLQRAAKDKNIKALLLRIDSPGGTVSASDELYSMLMDFRSETGKPVYAMLGSVAASGGYYVAMSANEVWARPTTITGSIGVIINGFGVEGLMEKVGVTSRVVKSGDFKDMGSPFKPPVDAEQKVLEVVVRDFYTQFLTVIEGNRRTISAGDIKRHADGRIFTARQAMHNGLIDGVTHLPELIEKIGQDLGIEPHVVTYTQGRPYLGSLYAEGSYQQQPAKALMSQLMPEGLAEGPHAYPPGIYYLWLP